MASVDEYLHIFHFLHHKLLGIDLALRGSFFNAIVDVHFLSRIRTSGTMKIQQATGENGADDMQILNGTGELLPIADRPVPLGVVGFKSILISYVSPTVATFLQNLGQLFASCDSYLLLETDNGHVLEFVIHVLLPLIKQRVYGIEFDPTGQYDELFHKVRQHVPGILNECPSLRVIELNGPYLLAFPAEENGSDGQALSNWLFTPRQDGLPKVLIFHTEIEAAEGWSLAIDRVRELFLGALSAVNFIVVITCGSVMRFTIPNNFTGEELKLKHHNEYGLLLVRCPISRDKEKWKAYEDGAFKGGMNRNIINVLQNCTGGWSYGGNPGTSNQQ